MTIPVVIVGGGGFGREVHQWIVDINHERPRYTVLGFLDEQRQGERIHDLPVLGDLTWSEANPEVAAVIAIGAPKARARIFGHLTAQGTPLPTLAHPRAVVGQGVRIGTGSILCPDVIATTDISIGRAVILNIDLTIGHDSTIEDFCTLAPGVHVSGNVRLRTGCDIGTGACFIPGVDVGAWTVVGAGAVVTSNLESYVTAVGVPAKPLPRRS